MRTILIVLTTMLFCACQVPPKEGEWYEHKGTRQRIQLRMVGTGKDCFEMVNRLADSQNAVFRETRGYDPFTVVYDSSHAQTHCVVFFNEGDILSRYFTTTYTIITAEQLRRDYTLVE